jgi:phosphoglycolate phosphatase
MECNICGSKQFRDMNTRKKVQCAACGSLERTRVIALFIQYYGLLDRDTRVLHIAPEKGLADYFYRVAGDNCTFVDLEPERFKSIPGMKKLDLCNDLGNMASNSYDLIVHSHVLEHVPCNYSYVLYHLNRLMSENGSTVCSIPILPGYYDACFSPAISDQERVKRFGQLDHVTRFGREDLAMTLGKVYRLEKDYDITRLFARSELERWNIPQNHWQHYTPGSVLRLTKADFLLA